jgi:hypothetical protein
MSEVEFAVWFLFMLIFVIFPIKPFFKYLFKIFRGKDTTPCTDEENYHEKHYSQLYRPGDKKYKKIVKLSNNARSIN